MDQRLGDHTSSLSRLLHTGTETRLLAPPLSALLGLLSVLPWALAVSNLSSNGSSSSTACGIGGPHQAACDITRPLSRHVPMRAELPRQAGRNRARSTTGPGEFLVYECCSSQDPPYRRSRLSQSGISFSLPVCPPPPSCTDYCTFVACVSSTSTISEVTSPLR